MPAPVGDPQQLRKARFREARPEIERGSRCCNGADPGAADRYGYSKDRCVDGAVNSQRCGQAQSRVAADFRRCKDNLDYTRLRRNKVEGLAPRRSTSDATSVRLRKIAGNTVVG